MISVVIPYVNEVHIDECVVSVRCQTPGAQIICQKDETGEGYSATCNMGRKKATGELIVFLNDDCVLKNDAFNIMAKVFEDPRVRAVGPYVLNPDKTPGLAFGSLPTIPKALGETFQLHRFFHGIGRGENSREGTFRVGYVGCCLMMRTRDPEWFDESFEGYYADVDLCRRLGHVVYTSEARVLHYGSTSYSGRKSTRLDEGLWHYSLKHSTPLTYWTYRLADRTTQFLRRAKG